MNRSTLLCGLVLIAIMAACVRTPDWPAEAGALWKRYVNSNVGYMVDYPVECTVEEHEEGVVIFVAVQVQFRLVAVDRKVVVADAAEEGRVLADAVA